MHRFWTNTHAAILFIAALCIGLARTVYIHRIWPYIWWFPCQKYLIYTVYIWFWPTLVMHHFRTNTHAAILSIAAALCNINRTRKPPTSHSNSSSLTAHMDTAPRYKGMRGWEDRNRSKRRAASCKHCIRAMHGQKKLQECAQRSGSRGVCSHKLCSHKMCSHKMCGHKLCGHKLCSHKLCSHKFFFFLSLWIHLWLAETSQQPISQSTWLKVTPHCNHCNHCSHKLSTEAWGDERTGIRSKMRAAHDFFTAKVPITTLWGTTHMQLWHVVRKPRDGLRQQ
jgi:hypothetical protein